MDPAGAAPIGGSSVRVTRLGLGGTGIGSLREVIDADVADQTVKAAYSAGLRLFDTAPVYGNGQSETRLGRALKSLSRDSAAVSTKVGEVLLPGSGNHVARDQSLHIGVPPLRGAVPDFTRDGVLRSLEGSLRRLGTDRIDICHIHDPDERRGYHPGNQAQSIRNVMEFAYPVLEELRAQGVIHAIGVGVNQWQLCVDLISLGSFDCFLLGGRYTLLEQGPADVLLPLCIERGISIIAGGPFNSGILASGAIEGAQYNYKPADQSVRSRVKAIEQVCKAHGVSLPAAALQFPLHHPAVASVIPGARSPQEMNQIVGYFQETIPDDFWQELSALGYVGGDD